MFPYISSAFLGMLYYGLACCCSDVALAHHFWRMRQTYIDTHIAADIWQPHASNLYQQAVLPLMIKEERPFSDSSVRRPNGHSNQKTLSLG